MITLVLVDAGSNPTLSHFFQIASMICQYVNFYFHIIGDSNIRAHVKSVLTSANEKFWGIGIFRNVCPQPYCRAQHQRIKQLSSAT